MTPLGDYPELTKLQKLGRYEWATGSRRFQAKTSDSTVACAHGQIPDYAFIF